MKTFHLHRNITEIASFQHCPVTKVHNSRLLTDSPASCNYRTLWWTPCSYHAYLAHEFEEQLKNSERNLVCIFHFFNCALGSPKKTPWSRMHPSTMCKWPNSTCTSFSTLHLVQLHEAMCSLPRFRVFWHDCKRCEKGHLSFPPLRCTLERVTDCKQREKGTRFSLSRPLLHPWLIKRKSLQPPIQLCTHVYSGPSSNNCHHPTFGCPLFGPIRVINFPSAH